MPSVVSVTFQATVERVPKGCRKPRTVTDTFTMNFGVREHYEHPVALIKGEDFGPVTYYISDKSGFPQWYSTVRTDGFGMRTHGRPPYGQLTPELLLEQAGLVSRWNYPPLERAIAWLERSALDMLVLPDNSVVVSCFPVVKHTTYQNRGVGIAWWYGALDNDMLLAHGGRHVFPLDTRNDAVYTALNPDKLDYGSSQILEVSVFQQGVINEEFLGRRKRLEEKLEATRLTELMEKYPTFVHKAMIEALGLYGYTITGRTA